VNSGLTLSRGSTTWTTLPALFCVGYFQDKVLQTICLLLTFEPSSSWSLPSE
jgi:hypothetical protein